MITPRFKGEPDKAKTPRIASAGKCKCGRCTRNDERDDSSQASSDLG